MTSDGCLQKDGRHLDLTSAEQEQLTNFSKAIGRELAISHKLNGQGQPSHRIQFSDVAYYDFLLSTGLSPTKSKKLGPLCIPDEFYRDFLRGLFDGDGTSYGYVDMRWRSSFMFYASFASASLPFIQYLRQVNIRLAGVTAASIRKGARVHSLTYAKANATKLYRYMYYAEDVLCLRRKRQKFGGFIKRTRDGILL